MDGVVGEEDEFVGVPVEVDAFDLEEGLFVCGVDDDYLDLVSPVEDGQVLGLEFAVPGSEHMSKGVLVYVEGLQPDLSGQHLHLPLDALALVPHLLVVPDARHAHARPVARIAPLDDLPARPARLVLQVVGLLAEGAVVVARAIQTVINGAAGLAGRPVDEVAVLTGQAQEGAGAERAAGEVVGAGHAITARLEEIAEAVQAGSCGAA